MLGWAIFAGATQYEGQKIESSRYLMGITLKKAFWFPVKLIVVVFILTAVFYGLKPYLFTSVKTGGIDQLPSNLTTPLPIVMTN